MIQKVIGSERHAEQMRNRFMQDNEVSVDGRGVAFVNLDRPFSLTHKHSTSKNGLTVCTYSSTTVVTARSTYEKANKKH